MNRPIRFLALIFGTWGLGCAAESNVGKPSPDRVTATTQAAPPAASTQSVSATPPATHPTMTPTSSEKPFMFSEASLPAGYPPPGPVGQVILKHYPAYRAATVQSADVKGGGQNQMFDPLFRHIQRNDISMTAPVEMRFADRTAAATAPSQSADPGPPVAMSFLYRNASVGKLGADGVVRVADEPSITVLSVGVRGSYDGEHFRKGLALIRNWLAAHPNQYEVTGPPRFLGYNSPFVPWFLRFGEVQVPVQAR